MRPEFPSELTACAAYSLAAGSLQQYITAVQSRPILDEQRERTLAERLGKSGDLDAARDLILSHLRLVVSITRRYSGYGLPQADLIQEGNIGLMKAVKRFDPSRGVRLSAFAIHWIRAQIHEYVVRNWRLVKVATTKAQRKLFFNLRSLKQHAAALDPQSSESIARKLAVRPQDVTEMEIRLCARDVALENTCTTERDQHDPIASITADSVEPDAILEEQQNEMRQRAGLQRALATLEPRSRRIIEARWLGAKPHTLQFLGEELGISAERVRQIERRALAQMRAVARSD